MKQPTNILPIRSSKLTNEIFSPIGTNHKSDGIFSSTAQTMNGNLLEISNKSQNHPKIQIDDSSLSVRTLKSTPKLAKSPSSTQFNGSYQDGNTQLVTLPIEQLKDIIKETIKETLKDYNEKLYRENSRQQEAVSTMPIDQIKQFIKETVEDSHDDLMSEHFKFKIEIFKEFTQLEVYF